MFLFLLDKYLGVILLDHVVRLVFEPYQYWSWVVFPLVIKLLINAKSQSVPSVMKY